MRRLGMKHTGGIHGAWCDVCHPPTKSGRSTENFAVRSEIASEVERLAEDIVDCYDEWGCCEEGCEECVPGFVEWQTWKASA